MKRILKYLFILVALAAIGMVVAYFLAKKYEPEVRAVIVDEFNKNLAVEVDVEDINLSLLQRFPYASLRFSNVVIPQVINGEQQSDTLLFAEDLYLQIGLLDFFKQDYTVSEAELNHGFFDMELYKKGDNFHFWKADTSEAAGISITNVLIKNFGYHLANSSGLDLQVVIAKASANGNFGDAKYDIEAESDLLIRSVVQDKDTLYKDKSVSGDLTFDINHSDGVYDFIAENLEISNQDYLLKGQYQPQQKETQWVVEIDGENAKIERLIDLVPIDARRKLSKYDAAGNSDVKIDIKAGDAFALNVAFDDMKGSFQHHEALGKAEVNSAKGYFSLKDKDMNLTIDEADASIGPGHFQAWGKINDFEAPKVDLKLEGAIDLESLKSLLNIQLIEKLSGTVVLDGRLTCAVSSARNKTKAVLQSIDFKGGIEVVDGTIQMKNQGQEYDHITGELTLVNNAVEIKSASARVNENPFQFSGNIENVLPYITKENERLRIKANFEAGALDFNKILESDPTASDTAYFFKLPEDVSFDMKIAVDKIQFRRFEASNISGQAVFNNGQLSLNPIKFIAASGNVISNLTIRQKTNKQFGVESRSKLSNLDLEELFYAFENFDQSIILDENVGGLANADVFLAFNFDQSLEVYKPSITSEVNLEVIKGVLTDVKALAEISDYLRESALYRSAIDIEALDQKLRRVEFDTLANRITIKNEQVAIPKMTISSSALVLNAAGTHSFDNEIDYAVNFRLSDILRKGKVNENEFGNVIDDGTGLRIFFKMYGTAENPQFAMDKEAARAKRSQQFQDEKKTFKSILKEEFGLFKKDTSLTKVPEPEKKGNTEFSVEWGDTSTTKTDTTQKRQATKPKKEKPREVEEEDEDLYNDDDI